jgi:hypothetical protein
VCYSNSQVGVLGQPLKKLVVYKIKLNFMNKKMLLAILLGIFVIIILIVWLTISKPNNIGGLNIPGVNKQTVQTDDFVSPAPIKSINGGVLYFDDYFSIQYSSSTNDFLITFNAIHASDVSVLQQSRTKAEGILLSKLGVSQSDACKLKVTEQIQQSPALNYSSYVFPLSFCGQTDNFPK